MWFATKRSAFLCCITYWIFCSSIYQTLLMRPKHLNYYVQCSVQFSVPITMCNFIYFFKFNSLLLVSALHSPTNNNSRLFRRFVVTIAIYTLNPCHEHLRIKEKLISVHRLCDNSFSVVRMEPRRGAKKEYFLFICRQMRNANDLNRNVQL